MFSGKRTAHGQVARRRLTLYGALGRAHIGVALIAVLTAGISLTVLGLTALRVYADHNLRLVARSISYTVEAPVVFRDSDATLDSLAVIGASEDVAAVTVLDRDGRTLADWRRNTQTASVGLRKVIGDWLTPTPVELTVLNSGQPVGMVRVSGDPATLLHFLLQGVLGLSACLLMTALAAHYMSRRMMRDIVVPLHQLMRVAHAVRSERAFEQRMPAARIAELNELAEDFNVLLAELQRWQQQLQRENRSLAQRASHDSLTGLLNRAAFVQALEAAIAAAEAHQHFSAVLYLDSDEFKTINDSFGHAAGDAVLVEIAQRLHACVRETDQIARLGGDEFAVLIPTLRHPEDAVQIAENIVAAMRPPLRLPDGDIVRSALSVGVAVYPVHGQSPMALLNAADAAMYEAKRDARGTWRNASVSTEA